MVLILPEAPSRRYCAEGATTAGLVSSIHHALSSGCDADLSRVTVRSLGSIVVIEGLIQSEDCIDRIMEIAEEIAGPGHVSLRLFRQ